MGIPIFVAARTSRPSFWQTVQRGEQALAAFVAVSRKHCARDLLQQWQVTSSIVGRCSVSIISMNARLVATFCGIPVSARYAAGSFEGSTGVATGFTATGVGAGVGVAAGFDSVVQPTAKRPIATSASERMPTF